MHRYRDYDSDSSFSDSSTDERRAPKKKPVDNCPNIEDPIREDRKPDQPCSQTPISMPMHEYISASVVNTGAIKTAQESITAVEKRLFLNVRLKNSDLFEPIHQKCLQGGTANDMSRPSDAKASSKASSLVEQMKKKAFVVCIFQEQEMLIDKLTQSISDLGLWNNKQHRQTYQGAFKAFHDILRSSMFDLDRDIQRIVSKLYIAEEGNPLIRLLSYLERLYLEEISLVRGSGNIFQERRAEPDVPADGRQALTSEKQTQVSSSSEGIPEPFSLCVAHDAEIQCELGRIVGPENDNALDTPSVIDCIDKSYINEEKKRFFQTAAGFERSSKSNGSYPIAHEEHVQANLKDSDCFNFAIPNAEASAVYYQEQIQNLFQTRLCGFLALSMIFRTKVPGKQFSGCFKQCMTAQCEDTQATDLIDYPIQVTSEVCDTSKEDVETDQWSIDEPTPFCLNLIAEPFDDHEIDYESDVAGWNQLLKEIEESPKPEEFPSSDMQPTLKEACPGTHPMPIREVSNEPRDLKCIQREKNEALHQLYTSKSQVQQLQEQYNALHQKIHQANLQESESLSFCKYAQERIHSATETLKMHEEHIQLHCQKNNEAIYLNQQIENRRKSLMDLSKLEEKMGHLLKNPMRPEAISSVSDSTAPSLQVEILREEGQKELLLREVDNIMLRMKIRELELKGCCEELFSERRSRVVKEAKLELDKLQSTISESISKACNSQAQVLSLTEQKDQCYKESEEVKQKKRNIDRELKETEKALKTSHQDLAVAQEKVLISQKELQENRENLRSCHADLENKSKELDEVQKRKESTDKILEEKEKQLLEYRHQMESSKHEARQASSDLSITKTELQNIQKELTEKEHRNLNIAAEISDLGQQRDLVKDDVILLKNELQCLELQKQTKEMAIAGIKQDLDKAAERISVAQQEAKCSENMLVCKKDEIERLSEEAQNSTKWLATLKENIEDAMCKHKELNKLNEEIELDKRVEFLRTDVRCLEEELHSTACRLSQEKREKLQAVQSLEEAGSDIKILNRALVEARAEASKLRDEKGNLMEEMAFMRIKTRNTEHGTPTSYKDPEKAFEMKLARFQATLRSKLPDPRYQEQKDHMTRITKNSEISVLDNTSLCHMDVAKKSNQGGTRKTRQGQKPIGTDQVEGDTISHLHGDVLRVTNKQANKEKDKNLAQEFLPTDHGIAISNKVQYLKEIRSGSSTDRNLTYRRDMPKMDGCEICKKSASSHGCLKQKIQRMQNEIQHRCSSTQSDLMRKDTYGHLGQNSGNNHEQRVNLGEQIENSMARVASLDKANCKTGTEKKNLDIDSRQIQRGRSKRHEVNASRELVNRNDQLFTHPSRRDKLLNMVKEAKKGNCKKNFQPKN